MGVALRPPPVEEARIDTDFWRVCGRDEDGHCTFLCVRLETVGVRGGLGELRGTYSVVRVAGPESFLIHPFLRLKQRVCTDGNEYKTPSDSRKISRGQISHKEFAFP